jgi:hypothetical protein
MDKGAINLRTFFRFVLAVFGILLPSMRAIPADAVSRFVVTPAGGGIFLLQAAPIENAAAVEIVLLYDAETLAAPVVKEGALLAGAMTAVNAAVPGVLRIAVVRTTPMSGSGTLAIMIFESKNGSSGKITSCSVKLAGLSGAALPALVSIAAPTETSGDGTERQTGSVRTGSGSSPSWAVEKTGGPLPTLIPGPFTISPDRGGADEASRIKETDGRVPVEAIHEPAQGREPSGARNDAAQSNEPAGAKVSESVLFAHKSVLDRFREYRGERKAAALVSLFERNDAIGFSQDPPVALSDGKTTVRLTFISTPGDKTAGNVAVMGAKLVSLKKDPDYTNTWIAELMPEKGEFRASVAVSQGAVKMVYPLTIAPRADLNYSPSGKASEADLERQLKERKASAAKDAGKNDYLADYILTANYLVAAKKPQ